MHHSVWVLLSPAIWEVASKPEIEVGNKEYQDTNGVHEVKLTALSGLVNMNKPRLQYPLKIE